MFHNKNRVPLIAKFFKGVYKFFVVSLVQANAWLVQNIEDIYQLGPYLGSKAYPLTLSPAQAPCRTVQRKVIETHINKKSYPLPQLLDYIPCNCLLARTKFLFESINPAVQDLYVHCGNLADIF